MREISKIVDVKMTPKAINHPRVITENFDDFHSTLGLIKCTVLPPRGLFHPVLPYRFQAKLMFPLGKSCADVCNQTTKESFKERGVDQSILYGEFCLWW